MLGGHFKFFLTLGGPNLMGGSLDMMGGVSIFRLEKISLPYLLLLGVSHSGSSLYGNSVGTATSVYNT